VGMLVGMAMFMVVAVIANVIFVNMHRDMLLFRFSLL